MGEHCILVIEDQEDLAELYEATLKKAGYKVRNAFSGEEGIAEFQAGGADVVLLDMTLPEMHGTQVLREIRNTNASVPVIVVTAEENEQLREQCKRLGVQDYLAKPVNYEVMLTAVKLALAIPPEEAEIVTLRLPSRVVQQLTEIDSNLERAITRLVEERAPEANKAAGSKQ
jgi:two-component system response regulator RegX3